MGGIAKEQTSIADYKIKHQILKPPSIYAKRNEEELTPRNIITVPYKTAPRPPAKPMDPKQEAIKLAGIKDRIYAKNYLHIDAEKKEKMLKERETEIQDEKDHQLEVESPPRVKITRRKSVAEKVAVKPQPRRKSLFVEASRHEEMPPVTPRRKTILKTSRKRTAARLTSSDFEDDSYVPPDHVLEGIEAEAAEVLKAFEAEISIESTVKKVRKSVVFEGIVPEERTAAHLNLSDFEENSNVPQINIIECIEIEVLKAVEQPPASSKPSISAKRMTRSMSTLIEPSRLKTSGIDVLEEPVKRVPENKLPKPKVVTKPKPKKQVAKKRGRPALSMQTNIVSQAGSDALRLPADVIFSPPQSSHHSDGIDTPEDDLLIEIYGKKPEKTPKRTTQLRPRFPRRLAIDEPPLNLVPIEIKVEPPEES